VKTNYLQNILVLILTPLKKVYALKRKRKKVKYRLAVAQVRSLNKLQKMFFYGKAGLMINTSEKFQKSILPF